MIPKGLFSQISMLILSVSIIITYVKPAFEVIGTVQDSIEVYSNERKKIESVNLQLATLTSKINSVSNNDRKSLLTYLPDKVDEIAVSRDLSFIAKEAGIIYKNSSSNGNKENANSTNLEETTVIPKAHSFSLSVEGTYSQLKNFLRLVEQNNYPLEIHDMNITSVDGGFLQAEIDFVTYSYQEQVINNNIIF